MNNKTLGIIIIVITVLFAIALGIFRNELVKEIKSQVMLGPEGECIHEGNVCPYQKLDKLSLPSYFGIAVVVLALALGIYLIFFEKSSKMLKESQEKIVKRLEETKKDEISKERFDILLKGLDEDEKKVLKAVKEQDGITQSTLRIRTDISKTKLSVILRGLEKKGLIKKIEKGRTNQIFLKEKI